MLRRMSSKMISDDDELYRFTPHPTKLHSFTTVASTLISGFRVDFLLFFFFENLTPFVFVRFFIRSNYDGKYERLGENCLRLKKKLTTVVDLFYTRSNSIKI